MTQSPSGDILFRKARMGDARPMHSLLNRFAFSEKRELLPRSLSEIYDNLQQFHVAEHDGKIVGTCALYVTWDNLAEVKALCVDENYRHQGIGRRLLEACLQDAMHLQIRRIFTLTVQPDFFEKFSFGHVSKNALPHKVWTECVRCPYFPERCIEFAMVRDLPGVGPEPPAITFRERGTPTSGFEEGMLVPSEPKDGKAPL